MPAPFRIYNTLSRSVEDFVPVQPGHVGIYVCGMTVYDHIHVGHARAMVVFDAFVRYLRHRDWDVTFVRNFTDVDDKIIRRANEVGKDPVALAAEYIGHFHDDVAALGLAAPDREPRVSETIAAILAMIGRLVANGSAYAQDGTVWYDVASFAEYGKLSGQKVDELRSADEVEGKRAPADFALWKAVKPGEPSWQSPWGPGRPGWHIECSAMSLGAIGETLDIHGGGLDLVFPHHENEIAQSEAASGCHFSKYWMHNGLLTMASGQKMGKSLGNVINVRDALNDFPAEALRLYYLQNHYRSPLPWGPEALPEALAMLGRLYEARENAEAMAGSETVEQAIAGLGDDAAKVHSLGEGFEKRLYEALDSDFNTAQVLGFLFELARAVNRLANHKKAKKRGGPVVRSALAAFAKVSETMGLMTMTSADFMAEVKHKRLAAMGLAAADIDALLVARVRARADKNWARADEIRDELETMQIVVMDRGDTSDWKVRLTSAT